MSMTMHNWRDLDASARTAVLQRPALSQDAAIRAGARQIIDQVRSGGDEAVRELTRKFDAADLAEFKITETERLEAESVLTTAELAAIDLAIANVRQFHEAQRHEPVRVETMPGVVCEKIAHPIDSVGLYVPAGTAPLPSAAIMLAVPAGIAGCNAVVLCTPPRSDSKANPAVIVAATRAGVNDIYKVGGAQAIAAMAYGTESIPATSKIFGPGNAWVTAAKALVSVDPAGAAIDMPAGPSEVLVIGDSSASAEFIAADLLSQAEHGIDSQVMFVTSDTTLADTVDAEVTRQLAFLSRSEIAVRVIDNSRIIVTPDIETAIEVSNLYAPEHLILQLENARRYLPTVRNAGSVFVGKWTPESVGDYCSGTNHVLPTYGFARSYSGLGLDQFMRQMTIQELTRDGLRNLRDAVISLAGMEGLDAHAAAVTRRLEADV